MRQKECSFIQELLPLYAENLVSEETAQLIKEHLAGCTSCAQDWENFIRPLPDPVSLEKFTPEKRIENKLFKRLKKTVAAVVLLVIMSGPG
jgi:predicted anti-sigma-YlaC factor YlaD